MRVQTAKDPSLPDTLFVIVHTRDIDGALVGRIEHVSPSSPWKDLGGQVHVGSRWIPEGWVENADGPSSWVEAAAALLIDAGFSPTAVLNAQGMPMSRFRRVVAA